MRLKGAFTALITPFKNGQIDEDAYRALIEWQISEGINGLVPCGTTGESATLSHKEHEAVIRICVEQVNGRVPVIAGGGSNNTTEAISLTRFAKEAGADAVLHITPYYNKPTQEGLYQHFKTIAANVDIPLVLYNVPGRTGVNMLPATVARLVHDLPNVAALKEATANLTQISEVIERCGDRLSLLSGDDFTILPTMALGGVGVISVLSNILPKDTARLCAAMEQHDYAEARRLHFKMMPLTRLLFCETNPTPVKAALAIMGKVGPEIRLPLVPMSKPNEQKLREELEHLGLI